MTILEVLQNADYNLQNNGSFGIMIAKEQLHNATVLLGKGYSLDTDIGSLLEEHENVGNVPDVR